MYLKDEQHKQAQDIEEFILGKTPNGGKTQPTFLR
jgi:hypothetical protein